MKTSIKNIVIIAVPTLLVGLLLGWLIFDGDGGKEESSKKEETEKNQVWTCSMHPQIRQSEPGNCPICGMELIPVDENADQIASEVKMSPAAMQLADIQTALIEKETPVKRVQLNGKVQPDETQVFSQSSHLPGRIEQLMINYTGERVREGQTLAMIYSPELVTAQEELFEAYKIREAQPQLYQAAREKLKNWKLTTDQIDQIVEEGKVREQFPILADVSGVVLKKKVNLGDYIKKGESIYDIADLSSVWVLFDIYESDISWINEGDAVSFSVKSYPGEEFTGKIAFIDPVINSRTRVAQARVKISNPSGQFKPEMLVEGVVENPLQDRKEAIVVPKSTVMWTGERSVVYIKHVREDKISFSMREVTLGEALGNQYIIKEGLEAGEEIAVHGTFSIDAAAQLAGKPSMMNKDAGKSENGEKGDSVEQLAINDEAREAIRPVLQHYLEVQSGLANDDFEHAQKAVKKLRKAIKEVDMQLFQGEAHQFWMKRSENLEAPLSKAVEAEAIESLRKTFKPLSAEIILLFKAFGSSEASLFVDYCPMADSDKGATWLSDEEAIRNPYFGSSMLKCGEVKEVIDNGEEQPE